MFLYTEWKETDTSQRWFIAHILGIYPKLSKWMLISNNKLQKELSIEPDQNLWQLTPDLNNTTENIFFFPSPSNFSIH